MGALIALIPTIISIMGYVPGLASIISGPGVGTFLQKASDTLQKIFGSTDPAVIQAQLAAQTAEVQAKVDQAKAEIAAHLEEVRMQIEDVQDARSMEKQFLAAGSSIAWAPVIVTVAIFITFWGTCYAVWIKPPDSNNQIGFLIVGAVLTAFGGAWQYWLGSSSGSASKDTTIGNIARASAPAAAATAAATVKSLGARIANAVSGHQEGGR